MWLVKKQYKPFNKVFDRDIIDTFFSDMFDQTFDFHTKQQQAVVLRETDKDIDIKVEIPGYDKKDIQISYKDGYIFIHAETDTHKKEKNDEVDYSEFAKPGVSRNVYVGEINFDKAKATLKNGVLAIQLPKLEAMLPAYLEIS